MLIAGGLVFGRRKLIWFGLALLWIASTTMVSGRLTRIVEGGAQRLRATDVPGAEAIVVLSEGRSIAPGPARISEWIDADRFFGGIELFKARKAPLIVFTGGASPRDSTATPEGAILRGYARDFGVPDSSILVTGRATNTGEEAAVVAQALAAAGGSKTARAGARDPRQKWRILLVTSAAHMSRARRMFERERITVIPFPVDFRGSAGGRISIISAFLSLIPNAAALEGTESALRELYGRLFYALRY
jgi:uncharacterized SAM-binding protein YcdF (DUF218 family)